MGFADLKKNRGKRFDALKEKVEQNETAAVQDDTDNFWRLTPDKKKGIGTAIIRFLPEVDGENLPYAKFWDHFFKGPKGYYVEKSLTTIGKDDPVSEYNSELWNSGVESNKEIARAQKRRLNYVANIFIVEDHGDPSNNGTVRKFRFGKKIWEKIKGAMEPEMPTDKPINPFDMWDGANFKLITKKNGEFWSYESSDFAAPSPLSKDDKVLQSIYEQAEPLAEYTDPSTFKSYDELKTRLEKVLGFAVGEASVSNEVLNTGNTQPVTNTVESIQVEETSVETIDVTPDGDDDLSIFEDIVKNS